MEEKEKWELEKKKEEELKVKKIRKKERNKNITIICMIIALCVMFFGMIIVNYKNDFNKQLEEKDKQIEEIKIQEQLGEAYNKGMTDASVIITNQIVAGLNAQGFIEIDLPIGNNQTQKVKLGVIQ